MKVGEKILKICTKVVFLVPEIDFTQNLRCRNDWIASLHWTGICSQHILPFNFFSLSAFLSLSLSLERLFDAAPPQLFLAFVSRSFRLYFRATGSSFSSSRALLAPATACSCCARLCQSMSTTFAVYRPLRQS
jgi:hypothetical protein